MELCLPLIVLLVVGVSSVPVTERDTENDGFEEILVANADLENLQPRQVMEGDILVDSYTRHITGLGEEDDSVVDHLVPDDKRKKKATARDRQWPGGIVPYSLAPFLGEDAIKVIRAAMKRWMKDTCIKFVPRTNQLDYVRIVRKYGCWSWVGRIGGEQELSVGDHSSSNAYCLTRRVVIHELGHAIGFWHEHTRPDRDQFVTIIWENILPGKEIYFHKYSHLQVDSLNVKYDYESIMHFNKRAFGINGAVTMVPKKKVKIGQSKYPSVLDIKQTNLLYNCSAKLHIIRPGLPTKPEPPILIQSGLNGLCIQAHLITTGMYTLLLTTCNQDSLFQQWKWNGENQLYNPTTSQCISSTAEKALELHSCTSGDTLQQWLCANHFIEQPSNGNCMTVGKDLDQLIIEKCIMDNNRQLWNRYNGNSQSEMDLSLNLSANHSWAAESICTIPGYHSVAECYSERIHRGWSFCQRLGYFVTGLYHVSQLHLITDFRCCFTSHVFTGQPETISSIEEEICANVTWWSSLNTKGWFKCPIGLYFKGYLKDVQDGWGTVQQVKCCRTAQAPSIYRQCYTDSTDGSEGLHECSRTGYHIVGAYKTDCSFVECVERLLCCI